MSPWDKYLIPLVSWDIAYIQWDQIISHKAGSVAVYICHIICCGQLWVRHVFCGRACDELYHFPLYSEIDHIHLSSEASVSAIIYPGGLPHHTPPLWWVIEYCWEAYFSEKIVWHFLLHDRKWSFLENGHFCIHRWLLILSRPLICLSCNAKCCSLYTKSMHRGTEVYPWKNYKKGSAHLT